MHSITVLISSSSQASHLPLVARVLLLFLRSRTGGIQATRLFKRSLHHVGFIIFSGRDTCVIKLQAILNLRVQT
jgi:hypothetical protein